MDETYNRTGMTVYDEDYLRPAAISHFTPRRVYMCRSCGRPFIARPQLSKIYYWR